MAEIESLFSKEAIDQLAKVAELNTKIEATIISINRAGEKSTAYVDAQKQVASATKEQEKALRQLQKEEEKQAASAEKAAKANDDFTRALEMEVKTVAEAQKQNKALIQLRNSLNAKTKEGQKAISDLNKQIDQNNKTIKENASHLEKQKINIGNYISAWGPFQGIAMMVTRGIGLMKIAFYSLSTAIAATGIGALVIALGALYTYFTRTGEGADRFAKFMAQVRAVVDVLIDRFAKFGEGLVDIFSGRFKEGAEKISASFKGIGAELKEEVKTAGEMADKLDEIDEKRRKYQEEIAKNQIRIAQLEEIARDKESYSLEQQKAAIDEIMGLKRSNYSMTSELNQAEIDAINKQAAMRELNDDEQQKLTDARIKLMNEEAAAQSDINSSLKLRNKIYGEVNANQQADLRAANEIREQETIAASQFEISQFEGVIAAKETQSINFYDREKERRKEALKEEFSDWEANIAAVQQIGQQLFEFNGMLLQNEQVRIENARAYELQLAGDNAAKKEKIEKKYDEELRKLRTKQARAEKAQALFSAIVSVAKAITVALSGGPLIGIILAALTAAIGAVQIGVIASQPIPQFAKGTRRASGGLAWVGERGTELIAGPDGSMALTPGTATLVNLGKGGQRIYNNRETMALMRAARGADTPELYEMMNRLDEGNKRVVNAIRSKPVLHIEAGGRRISERGSGYSKTYMDKKINW